MFSSNEFYPLTNDHMWCKMILGCLKNTSDIENPEGYFSHQFKMRNDVFDNGKYFFTKCREHAQKLSYAFKVLVEKNFELPVSNNAYQEEIMKCEFVYGPDLDHKDGILGENVVLKSEDDFKALIAGLNKLIEGSIEDKTSKTELVKVDPNSFKLKDFNTKYEYIKDLKKSLIDNGFIHPDTKLASVRALLNNQEMESRIVWIGNISELSYFIKQLHNDLKLVEDLKQRQWFVAVKCFVDSNGNSFGREKLKGQKSPARKEKIDSALKTIQ